MHIIPHKMKRIALIFLAGLMAICPAQDEAAEPKEALSPEELELKEQALMISDYDGQVRRRPEDASVLARTNARAITRVVPAPRGIITDRKGRPMARNKVSYYFGIQFPQFAEDVTDEDVLSWSRRRLEQVADLVGKEVTVRDKDLLDHYRDRRWVPMLLPHLADGSERSRWEPKLMRGLIFQAVYLRDYPAKESAAHIIGYVRSKGKLPKGPILSNEPMWEDTYGEEGLENTLDDELTGKDGEWTLLVDENGDRLQDELTRKPVIGNTVITTIDLTWQQHAESVLRSYCRRGAFVVVDIQTGEILVLASRPSYDINKWIPFISSDDYNELREDEAAPMFARAYQGSYPPASTFKPVVAVTALTTGAITEWTKFNCPPFITIGSRKFHNHSRKHAGLVDVKLALAISNNPWFYQVGMKVGPTSFLSVARRMGYGVRTGVPLYNEAPGVIPTQEYMIKKEGRPFTDGDTANSAIGQGYVQATPLQVAQAMAALGNGEILPQLRLIRQIQDHEGGVLEATVPTKRNSLGITPSSARIARTGMMQVVNASYGTGKNGGTSFCRVAGKTGTAQWKGSGRNKQELAWFSGFLPYDNPRFAFAILYEGSPGQSVSGGKRAAPMVGRFFNRFAGEIMEKASTKIAIPTDEVIEEEAEETEEMEREEQRDLILRALPVDGAGTGIPEAPIVEEEPNEGPLDSTPPLRPLRVAPENEGLLRAVPIPEETEESEEPIVGE
ncbi:penicillin-binding transpeptidase domain-containing protein [Roseibacillus persicicus]|uniref:Beta-lactamase n=2 Tax=Roseibacillus persicicus TaxID=454148 RepID=A0A918TI34_9BACT|nr:penicillin-binding transpeptidase domain-containing protein [Roseibacillus persicicus]MDQ8191457.1 penicillin-binding transpeptidase domain-containing protein [Roseibacillus persicicus]GHC43114.1 beta-lactamase [Roseibacillus persicicus]